MADNQPSIQQALNDAMQQIGAVKKDGRNTHQNFNFRGIDATVNAVSPALQKHGIVVTPELQSLNRGSMQTARGAAMNQIDVIVKYTFTGPAGDTISATVPGEAFDSGDKATAKAMSVAFRIALLQSLALPTDDPDPDADSYDAQPAHQQPQSQQHDPTPEEHVRAAWGSAQQLVKLGAWYAKQGAPDTFLQPIRDRVAELNNAQPVSEEK